MTEKPWLIITKKSLVEKTLARADLDEETRGRLLHHVQNCPDCKKESRK